MVKPREHRVPMMLSTEELEAIDTWRFDNRVATRSEAIRRLVQIGILSDSYSYAALKNARDAITTNIEFFTRFLDFLIAEKLNAPRELIDHQVTLQPMLAKLLEQTSNLAISSNELKAGKDLATALSQAAAQRREISETHAPLKSLIDELLRHIGEEDDADAATYDARKAEMLRNGEPGLNTSKKNDGRESK